MSEIIVHAEKCNKSKVKWHFHILTPDCAFSQNKRYSIVFENEKTGEHLITFFDEKHSRAESRYKLLGKNNAGKILFIAFTIRGQKIRIISARSASQKERNTYGKKI